MKRDAQVKTNGKSSNPVSSLKKKSSIQNSEINSPARRERRPYHYKSEESRMRAQVHLKPIKPGEVLNPGGRPKKKPFHDAAKFLAEQVVGAARSKNNILMIKPTDTVASAVMKSLAASAMSFGPQKVSAAKELADRAEGPPAQIIINENDADVKSQRFMKDLFVRFGVELRIPAATVPTDTE